MNKLHFTIGNDLGITLHEISLEKLYNFDIKGALSVWTESFGCSENIAKKLMLCEYICDVKDSEKCVVNVIPKEDFDKNRLEKYYLFSYKELEGKIKELFNLSNKDINNEDIYFYIKTEYENRKHKFIRDIELNKTVDFDFSVFGDYDELFDFVTGTTTIRKVIKYYLLHKDNIDSTFESIKNDNNRIYSILYFINYWDKIILKSDSIKKTLCYIDDSWGNYIYNKISQIVIDAMEFMQYINDLCINKTNESCVKPNKTPLEKHIESAMKIQKELNDFHPVNILDKYDAGWLAPNGDFFGLNGEVSNLLHINLANEIIEYYNLNNEFEKEKEKYINKDYFIAKKGFVKITKDWILYEGYDKEEFFNKKNTPLTEIQKKKIVEYGAKCYDQKLFFGYEKIFCSTPRFETMDDYHIEELLKLNRI